jgi:hypothetical protein
VIPRAHHLPGPGTRVARAGLVLGSRRVAGLLVQEDQGKALTDWWVLGRWLPCPSDRKDAAEGRRASIPRDSPAQIPPPLRHLPPPPPPPPSNSQGSRQGRGEASAGGRSPVPSFLAAAAAASPARMVSAMTVSSSATSRCGFSSAVCCCCLCTVPLCSAHHQRTRSRSLSSRGEGRVGEIRSATLLFFHKLQFRHIVRFGLAVAGCLPPAFSLGSILIDRVDEQAKPSEHSCSPSVERRIRPPHLVL